VTAAETDDPQVSHPTGPFPSGQAPHQPPLSPSHPQTLHALFQNLSQTLLSTNPPNKHLTPFTYRPKKINNQPKTSQTTLKRITFQKKNSKQKTNYKQPNNPNTTKAHTQTHQPTPQTNTTITPPPLPTPHTTIRTTHRNSMGPYIYCVDKLDELNK